MKYWVFYIITFDKEFKQFLHQNNIKYHMSKQSTLFRGVVFSLYSDEVSEKDLNYILLMFGDRFKEPDINNKIMTSLCFSEKI